jgi:glucose/arabinose dehydrogenase
MAPLTILAATLLAAVAQAQQGCGIETPEKLAVAKGYTARIFATGVKSPRALLFDSKGRLLVLQKGQAVTSIALEEDAKGCALPRAGKQATVAVSPKGAGGFFDAEALNHGLQLSADEKKLWASSRDKVYSWDYDVSAGKATGQPFTWMSGMNGADHESRTLLLSKKQPGTLLVSKGSTANFDPGALDVKTGISQIRAFDVSGTPKLYKYTDGKLIGWGLRNSVGLGENPLDGGIWSNENGVDDVRYLNASNNVHNTSPGEEINYHGTLAGNSELHGKNYGYPHCAPIWDTSIGPGLKVGAHFAAIPAPAEAMMMRMPTALTDNNKCSSFVPPKLTLPPHWAPIDMEFNSKGSNAYMTSRGSW